MITEVTLEAFKCFKYLQPVELKRVNLFLGCNGRGKSTFLQSLLLLAQSMDDDKRLNQLQFNGRFLELGNYDDVQSCYTSATPTIRFKTDDKEENIIQVKFTKYPRKDQWGKLLSLKANEKELVEQIGAAKGSISDKGDYGIGATSTLSGLSQLHNVYFVTADRNGPIDTIKQNDNLADNIIGIHGENMLNNLFRKDSEFMQHIIRETSYILSGAYIAVQKDGTDYIRLLLDSVNGSHGFRPSNVGFGYSYVLPIILTMLSAEKNAKIFIENPEAHLHPGAQSRLMDFIIRIAIESDLQVFIETHSDHLINGLRIAVKNQGISKQEARIIFFDRQGDQPSVATQIKIDAQGNLSDYPDGFMDEWGIQMSQLL